MICLKYPDVKKDEFGKWCYSGSHIQSYVCRGGNQEMKFERLTSNQARTNEKLRSIRCKHPSKFNAEFQRLLAFVTGVCVQSPYCNLLIIGLSFLYSLEILTTCDIVWHITCSNYCQPCKLEM